MRINVLSDLHLEPYDQPRMKEVDFDVVALAGDIAAPDTLAVAWVQETFGANPVVFVPGHHEFYGTDLSSEHVDTWIHGHTHAPFNYMDEGCRVLSNPRGYRMRNESRENPIFDEQLAVDTARHSENGGIR